MSSRSGGDVEDVAREEEDIAIKARERCRGLQVALGKWADAVSPVKLQGTRCLMRKKQFLYRKWEMKCLVKKLVQRIVCLWFHRGSRGHSGRIWREEWICWVRGLSKTGIREGKVWAMKTFTALNFCGVASCLLVSAQRRERPGLWGQLSSSWDEPLVLGTLGRDDQTGPRTFAALISSQVLWVLHWRLALFTWGCCGKYGRVNTEQSSWF